MRSVLLPVILSLILILSGCAGGGNYAAETEAPEGTAARETVPDTEETDGETKGETSGEIPAGSSAAEGSTEDPGNAGHDRNYSTRDYIGRTYNIYAGMEMSVYLTEDGRIYDGLGGIREIRDIRTGELKYYAVQCCDMPGEGEEAQPEFALYDPSGNQVLPYEPFSYTDAIGDLVLRGEYYSLMFYEIPEDMECGLYNVKTQEYVLKGVEYLSIYDGLICAFDMDWRFMGFVNEAGELYMDARGMDEEFLAYRDGYFLLRNERPGIQKIYDRNLKEIFAGDINETIYLDDGQTKGDVFYVNRESSYSFYRLSDRQLIFECDCERLAYFDDALIAMGTWDAVNLYDLEGNLLAGPFETFASDSNYFNPEKAACFYGRSGGKLYKLDRAGQVMCETTLPAAVDFNITGDYIQVSYSANDATRIALYDMDLNKIPLDPKYSFISCFSETDPDPAIPGDLFTASYRNRLGFERYDLLDKQGNVLAEGFLSIYPDKDRILGYKGSSVGFLDTDGTWTVTDTIYDTYFNYDR